MHRLDLIMSQLAGDDDMARNVRDILSTSVQPSRDIRVLMASTRVSRSSRRLHHHIIVLTVHRILLSPVDVAGLAQAVDTAGEADDAGSVLPGTRQTGAAERRRATIGLNNNKYVRRRSKLQQDFNFGPLLLSLALGTYFEQHLLISGLSKSKKF